MSYRHLAGQKGRFALAFLSACSDILSNIDVTEQSAQRRPALRVQLNFKEAPMPTGTVKWFNETKGYGFIQPDNGGKDVFVHVSAVERSGMRGLAEGQKISYELETDRKSGKESAANLKSA